MQGGAMMDSYEEFLKSKRLVVKPSGFEPHGISDKLFPFQGGRPAMRASRRAGR